MIPSSPAFCGINSLVRTPRRSRPWWIRKDGKAGQRELSIRGEEVFFDYVLQSQKDQKYYIGHTNNLERRIQDHNRGKSKSVKNRGPFQLVLKEVFAARVDAITRERQIKKYKGGDAFKKLIQENTFDPIV